MHLLDVILYDGFNAFFVQENLLKIQILKN